MCTALPGTSFPSAGSGIFAMLGSGRNVLKILKNLGKLKYIRSSVMSIDNISGPSFDMLCKQLKDWSNVYNTDNFFDDNY